MNVTKLFSAKLLQKYMSNTCKRSYNKNNYNEKYRRTCELLAHEKGFIDKVLSGKNGGFVLDVGCGAGVLYDSYIIDNGFSVSGLDISTVQLERAKNNCPDAEYIEADFSIWHTNRKYDAVTFFINSLTSIAGYNSICLIKCMIC